VKVRTWPALALGFGSLLLLVLLSGLDSWRRVGRIYTTVLSIQTSHTRADQALHEIESGIYLSAVFIRDFLLDISNLTAEFHRDQLRAIRASMDRELKTLEDSTASGDREMIERLRREIDAYWSSMDPVFDWTPAQKLAASWLFLRRNVLPRRAAVLEIAGQARKMNAGELEQRQREMDSNMAEFRRSGQRTLILVLALAAAASLASILRVSHLESRAAKQHAETERAEREMRRLSHELVRAQEDERRNLSRELHDEIGQTLTALGVELANLERLRASGEGQFEEHLQDAKQLAAQTLRSVRDIAMGLRPALLDDLGLGPALEWQGREFSRRTGIPVEVLREGLREDLPEGHRTCLYRVVQEALTNCARHAEAKHIRVALHTEVGRLSLTVQDDGQGLPPQFQRERADGAPHMGLVGIEERIRELGGALVIDSQAGKGTLLKVWIPLPQEQQA
jgi:signal transduction histidine kinase